jgi:hypothetical protein
MALETAMHAMKSRRRITFLKASDHANCIDHYSRDFRPAEWGSGVSLHGSNPEPLMSGLGQKRTLTRFLPMSALPAKADMADGNRDVRFVPTVCAPCKKAIRISIG